MFELLAWIVKLPFALIGLAFSILFSVLGIVLSIVGTIAGGLWTAFAFGLALLLLVWLLFKLTEKPKQVFPQR